MRSPNLLLINPPVYDFSAYDLWSRPLGLLYLASVLRRTGCRVFWLDAMDRYDPWMKNKIHYRTHGDGHYYKSETVKPKVYRHIPRKYYRYGLPQDELRSRIEKIDNGHRVDAVLITSLMTYWYLGVFETIRLCKEMMPQTPVILGGIYATLYPEHARTFSGADAVITGPGETTLIRWVRETFHLPETPDDKALPDDVFPAYDLYPEPYHAAIQTSRGCPYRCPFCASAILSPTFNQRPPESVVHEIQWLTGSLGVRHIAFYDDALFVRSERHIKPILRRLIEQKIRVAFHSPNGLFARLIDRELAELMHQSGFVTIRLSFESSDSQRQNEMKKVSNVDLNRAISYLEQSGFQREKIKVYLMMGLNGQSPAEVAESIRFVHDQGVAVSLSSYSPIPGTRAWAEDVRRLPALREEPLLTNKTIYPMRHAQFRAEDFEVLKQMANEGNRKIYAHS